MGTVTSWNPLGHSRPVMGPLYLICLYKMYNKNILMKITGKTDLENAIQTLG
jgi:hypothetical protein